MQSLIDELKVLFADRTGNEFRKHEDLPYEVSDFVGIKARNVTLSKGLEKLPSFDYIKSQNLDTESKDVLAHLLIFLSQNRSLQFWNDEAIVSVCNSMLEPMCKVIILCNENEERGRSLMHTVLLILRQKLNSNCWLLNPMAMHSFLWCLITVRWQHLSDYLDMVFNTPLLFLDHYLVENELFGLACLEQIIDKTSPSELRMYGRADVYYDCVFKLLYSRQIELIERTYPCALKLSQIIDKPNSEKWTKSDDVFIMLLGNMEMESSNDRKIMYCRLLKTFMDVLGIRILAHSKILLRIFRGNLELGYCRLSAITLECVDMYMKVASCRLDGQSEEFSKILIRCIMDCRFGEESDMYVERLKRLAIVDKRLNVEQILKAVNNTVDNKTKL